MYARLILFLARGFSAMVRPLVVGLLFLNGVRYYLREIYLFRKKTELFRKYPNGVIYDDTLYLPDGSISTDLPQGIPVLDEAKHPNLGKILRAYPPSFLVEGG